MTACKIAGTSPTRHGLSTLTGTDGAASSLHAVASSIAGDQRLRHLVFVVRDARNPSLYAFGELAKADLDRLQHLSMQITRADLAARYVDYTEAERLAGVLAEKLTARYGNQSVYGFEYRAIPTGGTIVLGMLAYALGLPARCLAPQDSPQTPLVMVDDCVLSGMRFKQHRQSVGLRPVSLAALFAPEALVRDASSDILATDCVAAVELPDLAPELYGQAYPAWLESWRARSGDSVLWVGQPEYLCFAWNEPQSAFFNAVTAEVEPAFRLVAGDRCLRRRHMPADQAAQVQVFSDGPGPCRAAPSVVSAQMVEGRIAVAAFPQGQDEDAAECYLLEGTAADMWTLLNHHGTIQAASRALCNLYDADAGRVVADMTEFAGSLVEQGLLVRA